MSAPTDADILNGLRATTARDDAHRLAEQLRAAS